MERIESYATSIFHLVRGYYARYLYLRKLNYPLCFIKKIDKGINKHTRTMAHVNVAFFPFDFFNLRAPRNTPCVIYSVLAGNIIRGTRIYGKYREREV